MVWSDGAFISPIERDAAPRHIGVAQRPEEDERGGSAGDAARESVRLGRDTVAISQRLTNSFLETTGHALTQLSDWRNDDFHGCKNTCTLGVRLFSMPPRHA